ncbi:LacI family DNA-binding transcriptional regulator [Arcanobacterium hippocoleae]
MRDVAERAGVSKSAVSFALNDPGKLAESTVTQILQAAADLGYVRNSAARSMRTNATNSLGLLLPQAIDEIVQNPYYSSLMQGIGQVCQAEGYTLLLVPPLRGSMLKAIPTASVDGFIISGLEEKRREVIEIINKHTPMVVVDPTTDIDVPTVEIEDNAEIERLVAKIIQLGHRNIGIAAIETATHSTYKNWRGVVGKRMAAIMREFESAGMDTDSENITFVEVPSTYQGGIEAFHALRKIPVPPTVIICFSDVIALGVLEAARMSGVQVPDELSVTGYDDIPISSISAPKLSTIHQPIISKGRLAAQMLIDEIRSAGHAAPHLHQKLAASFIFRDSLGMARDSG